MTHHSQGQNAVSDYMAAHLPHLVESYDITAQARLQSAIVAKKAGRQRREQPIGRELWDGGRIREIREDRKLSQDGLSGMSGVSKGDISRHERNDPKSNPSVAALVRLSLALNVPQSSLLEPTGSPIPRPGETTGHVERPRQHLAVLESLVAELDIEAPAEDSWRGDVYKALAALNRALRRGTDTGQAGAAPATTRR